MSTEPRQILKAWDDTRGAPATCRSCGAAITWYELVSGKRHPFNGHDPVPLRTGHIDNRLVAYMDGADSHFATCPDAKAWKRR